jgi:anti-sigma B factor antagonist
MWSRWPGLTAVRRPNKNRRRPASAAQGQDGAYMEQPSSHLKIRREADVAVVEFADRKILEELSIQEIGEELNRLADTQGGIRMLLNFKNVDHLSSAALGMLITLNKKIKERSGVLKLSDINRQIFEVFKITRLNRVFDIHETADQALSGFQTR